MTEAQVTPDDESAADGVQFFTGGPIHYFENEDDAYERSRAQEDF